MYINNNNFQSEENYNFRPIDLKNIPKMNFWEINVENKRVKSS